MITASIVISLTVVYCFSVAMIDNNEKLSGYAFFKALLITTVFGFIVTAVIRLMVL